MKNKPFQTLLKIWIAIASLGAFLFGWAVLGHSGKPVSFGTVSAASSTDSGGQLAPLPTLAPLQFNSSSNGLQPLQSSQQSFNFAAPRLRSRGS